MWSTTRQLGTLPQTFETIESSCTLTLIERVFPKMLTKGFVFDRHCGRCCRATWSAAAASGPSGGSNALFK